MKAAIIIGILLMVIGLAILLAVLISCNFNFKSLSSEGYKTEVHHLTETVDSLSILTKTADVELIYSTDGSCRVECYEQEKQPHTLRMEEGKLVISMDDRRKWYDYLGIHFSSPKIKVYLPRAALSTFDADIGTGSLLVPASFSFESGNAVCSTGDLNWVASVNGKLNLRTTTGDIAVSRISAGSLELSVTTGDLNVTSVTCQGDAVIHVNTGDMTLSNLSCANLTSTGSTGDANLSNVIVSGSLNTLRSTGDVHLTNCDSQTLSLKASTGDIICSLLSEKIYITQTSTGNVCVPKSTIGGLCEITTSTGDIYVNHKATAPSE